MLVKKIVILLTVLAGISLAAQEFTFNAALDGWKKSSKENIFTDNAVKVSKECSVRLENGGQLLRTLELEPDSAYEITFYIKGKEIESGDNKGARIMLNAGKNWARVVANPEGLPETGSFDWKKGSGTIDTGRLGSGKINIILALIGKGTVWFDDLKIEKKKITGKNRSFRKSYSSDIESIALIPQGVFGFFNPGETVKFKFELDSTSKDIEYALCVKDESGRKIYETPRKKYEKEFSIPGQANGYYVVETDVFVNGKKAYYLQSAFVVNRPFVKRDPFFSMGYGVYADMLEGLKRIGVGTLNLKIHWNTTGEERDPKFLFDYCMNGLRHKDFFNSDFHLTAVFGASLMRKIRSENELAEGMPIISDKLLNRLVQVARLYAEAARGRIKDYAVQQEIPSNAVMKKKYCGTWTEAMFNQLIIARLVSRTVKKVDPEIRVWVGGNNMQEYTADIERIVMGDLVKDFDGYMIDAYTGNWNMTLGNYSIPERNLMNFYRQASALSDSLGKGKLIKNEEFGYAIHYGAPFDEGLSVEQAYCTARALIITKAAPVASFELHMPFHSSQETGRSDNAVCMTTVWKPIEFEKKAYGIPLPGGAMYATAAAELSFAKFHQEVIHTDIYSYIFTKQDGSTLITLWNTEKEQPFTIELPVKAKVVNMYGREYGLATGKQTLNIGPEPLYISLDETPAKVITLIQKEVVSNSPEFKCGGIANDANSSEILVKSLVKNTLECKLMFPGIAEKNVTILPGKVNTFVLPVTKSGILVSPDGRKYEIPIEKCATYAVGRIAKKPVFDGSGAWLKGLPYGVLKYPENIRPSEALQPERHYFKTDFNPEGHSVSAKYWTAYDDANFYLAAEVDDPVHLQRYTNDELWRDDSLQFVFATGNVLPATVRSGTDENEKSEFNFGVALSKKGTEYVKFLGKDCGAKEYPAKVTRKDGKTLYEIAVPWKALGATAKQSGIRFGFVIFDNNYPTLEKAPYWLEFSPGIAGGNDSSKLKLLNLE